MSSACAPPSSLAARTFGYEALGPILAEFSLRLWLFQRFLPDPGETTFLFCARGGLRLKLVFERFLARSGLHTEIASENLMVSRLVAARAAVAKPGDALLSELGREFEDRPMRDVAAALAQRSDLDLGGEWHERFQPDRFVTLLTGQSAGAAAVRDEIAQQNDRFRAHLAARTQGRPNIILCDTGLYGSTVRLLREGMPDRRWYCLQFARSNYKRLATPHFDCTRGLCVESDFYRPWQVETSVLRFWQLIEATLEPPLPSVRRFEAAAPNAEPRSNLEIDGWERLVAPTEDWLFAGALSYIDQLNPAALPQAARQAKLGWRRFKRAAIWPDAAAIAALNLEDRSRDFGRPEQKAQFAQGGSTKWAVARIRESLWREGAIMQFFPRFGRFGLVALELAYSARAVKGLASQPLRWRRRRRISPRITGEQAGFHP